MLEQQNYKKGGNPAAGGTAAVASEAAANYFANQYKDDPRYQNEKGEFIPNLLPEDVKTQIRDLTAAIGAVAGGTVGDSASNAQLAGVIGQNAAENNNMTLPYPVNQDMVKNIQSLIDYGVKQGWSDDKMQQEIRKELRGKGIEVENKDIVEVLDKTGKAATVIGIYPSPYTKPIGAVGGALGTASILVDNKKTWSQKFAELFFSNAAAGASGLALKKVDDISEGVKRAHNAVSGEIGGKIPETYKECKTLDVNGKKKVGC